jgi:hypothetical protein
MNRHQVYHGPFRPSKNCRQVRHVPFGLTYQLGRKTGLSFTDFPGTQVRHGPFRPTKNRC